MHGPRFLIRFSALTSKTSVTQPLPLHFHLPALCRIPAPKIPDLPHPSPIQINSLHRLLSLQPRRRSPNQIQPHRRTFPNTRFININTPRPQLAMKPFRIQLMRSRTDDVFIIRRYDTLDGCYFLKDTKDDGPSVHVLW